MAVPIRRSLVDRGSLGLGDRLECSHQLAGDRSRSAASDDTAIDQDDRTHFGCSAGDKHLVGRVHVVVPKVLLDERKTMRCCDLEDHCPGDPAEVVQGRGSVDDPVLDDEDVVTEPSAIYPLVSKKIASSPPL